LQASRLIEIDLRTTARRQTESVVQLRHDDAVARDQTRQPAGKAEEPGFLAMREKHGLPYRSPAPDPSDKFAGISMARIEIELADASLYFDFFALDAHTPRAVQQDPAERSLGLVSGHHDRGIPTPKISLEVMTNASRIAHAARSDHHEEAAQAVDCLALLHGFREAQIGRLQCLTQ